MSKESYARGFCKAAAAAGVDPVELIKYADNWQPASIEKSFRDWVSRHPYAKTDTSSKDTISADDILGSAKRVGWTPGGTTSTPAPGTGAPPPRVVQAPQTNEWSRLGQALSAKGMGTPASAVTKSVANQGSINKSLEELKAFGDWADKRPSAIISTGGPRVVSAPAGHEFANLGNALARRASTAGKVNAITPATISADQIINAAKRVGWTPRPASTAAGVAKLGR